MSDEPTSGVEAALTTLCNAVMADISEAKRRLDADIPKDAPVHPVSAFLTGTALHVGKARAALATPAASPTSGVEAVRKALERADRVFHFDLRHMIEWGDDYNQAVKDAADGVRAALRAALATRAASPATVDDFDAVWRETTRMVRLLRERGFTVTAASPSPAPAAVTGWLIELKGVTPSWAIVNPNDYDEHWTTDSTRALRFARKADAEAYIAHIGWTEAFASEHVWDDGRRSGYSDRSTADYLDKRLQEARDRSPDYEKLWAEEAERAEAAQEEIETLKALICRIEPYVDAIVCYASTMGEHEPNCIAHEVRAVCHGPSQDELVGRQIAAQMIVKIDAAASPPALAARSTEAWRDLDNARLQRAIDAFYEPCEGTTIDGIRNAILAWERG